MRSQRSPPPDPSSYLPSSPSALPSSLPPSISPHRPAHSCPPAHSHSDHTDPCSQPSSHPVPVPTQVHTAAACTQTPLSHSTCTHSPSFLSPFPLSLSTSISAPITALRRRRRRIPTPSPPCLPPIAAGSALVATPFVEVQRSARGERGFRARGGHCWGLEAGARRCARRSSPEQIVHGGRRPELSAAHGFFAGADRARGESSHSPLQIAARRLADVPCEAPIDRIAGRVLDLGEWRGAREANVLLVFASFIWFHCEFLLVFCSGSSRIWIFLVTIATISSNHCALFIMPRYYCDYCDTYLTHDSPSVRKQHNAGYKHKANVRSYYQQFEEQQTQSLIDQRIKEHLGQAAYQVGATYLASLQPNVQRPRLPVLPTPILPMPGASQAPLPAIRPPILPRPLGAPGYGSVPPSMTLVAPPGANSAPMPIGGPPRPPMFAPPAAGGTSAPAINPTYQGNPMGVSSGPGGPASAPPPTSMSQDGFMYSQPPEANH